MLFLIKRILEILNDKNENKTNTKEKYEEENL